MSNIEPISSRRRINITLKRNNFRNLEIAHSTMQQKVKYIKKRKVEVNKKQRQNKREN